MLPVGLARAARRVLVLMALLLVVSCGGTGGGDGSRPTPSPTRTPTASPPSPERPTRSVDQTESPAEPSAAPSSEPAEQPPTSETAPTAEDTGEAAEEPAESGEESATEASEEEGVPTWLWWLLAALLIGCVVAIPLAVGARRRSVWRQELARQEGELAWFARELLSGFRHAGSREQVTGGWVVSRERVTAAEDRLTVLESTAPDDAGRQRARSLRDAARQARVQMEHVTGPGSHDTWALDLDAIIADLELAIRRSSGSSPE